MLVSVVSQISQFVVRVTFSEIPKCYDPTLVQDALNPFNYIITGPGVVKVNVVMPTSGDPFSVDLYINGTLTPDISWTLNIGNTIQDVLGNAVSGDLAIEFLASNFLLNSILGGASNENAEQVIRRYINPKLSGKVWTALIAALATGEQYNWNNALYAFNQLFITTATGPYLKQRGRDNGIDTPKNVVLDDETFSKYVKALINRQLSLNALNEVLEIFYGESGTHAVSLSNGFEPYNLTNGSELTIQMDQNDPITIVFNADDFEDIASASALEVSFVINSYLELLESGGYAYPYLDPNDGNTKIKLVSSNLGTESSVTVHGGIVQNQLQFSTVLTTYDTSGNPLPTWNVTYQISTNRFRFESTTSPTNFSIQNLQIGDYVNITGSEFNSGNVGSFPIVGLSIVYPLDQYFEIENINGVAQSGVIQSNSADLMFFRPTKNTIYSVSPVISAFVAQTDPDELTVSLPATSQAISRNVNTGAYLTDYDYFDLTSGSTTFSPFDSNANTTTIVLSGSADLPETGNNYNITMSGQQLPNYTSPSITNGNGTSTVDSSSVSIWSNLADNPNLVENAVSIRLNDGTVVGLGGDDPASPSTYSNAISVFKFNGSVGGSYTWSSGTMTQVRKNHAASPILNSGIMVTGGDASGSSLAKNTTEFIYVSPTGVVTSVAGPNLNTGRSHHAQCTLGNGTVCVFGGKDASGTPLNSVEYYNPVLNAFVTSANMNMVRVGHAAIPMGDLQALLIGDPLNTKSCSCELYSFAGSGSSSYVGNRSFISSTGKSQIIQLMDGRILSVGAYGYNASSTNGNSNIYSCEIYDPDLKYWIKAPNLIPDNIFGFTDQLVAASCSYTSGNYCFERILVMQTSQTDQSQVYCQFLDIPRTQSLLSSAVNNIKHRWRQGPSFTGTLTNFSLIGSTNNSILAFSGNSSGSGKKAWLYISGADEWGCGNFSKMMTATLNSGNYIINNSEYRIPCSGFDFSTEKVQFMEAPSAPVGTSGPYLFDTSETDIPIVDPQTTLTSALYEGLSYNTITVASTSGFPDNGWLVFNYGYDDNFKSMHNLIYPVKYTNILTSTQIRIDPSFVFPTSLLPSNGTITVNPVTQFTPYNPNGAFGSFYLTDSAAGRIAAQNAVDKIVAGGIDVNYEVKYPGDQGLGGSGFPINSTGKMSDVVEIWSNSEDEDGAD